MKQYLGMFALALVAIVAIVWLEHQSSAAPGTRFTFGFGAGSLPPWLYTAGPKSDNVISGGPTSGPSSSFVALPDVQVPVNSTWGS